MRQQGWISRHLRVMVDCWHNLLHFVYDDCGMGNIQFSAPSRLWKMMRTFFGRITFIFSVRMNGCNWWTALQLPSDNFQVHYFLSNDFLSLQPWTSTSADVHSSRRVFQYQFERTRELSRAFKRRREMSEEEKESRGRKRHTRHDVMRSPVSVAETCWLVTSRRGWWKSTIAAESTFPNASNFPTC